MGIDCKVKNKKIILEHNLREGETYKISHRDKCFSLSIYKQPQVVKGITSMCEDGKHILMLDYDWVCKWIVEREIKNIADKQGLLFFVFNTREEDISGEKVGHYHAICPMKFTTKEILDIQRETSCDRAYTTMPLRNIYRSWVLRFSGKEGSNKPKYIKRINGSRLDLNRPASNAHLVVLKKLYNKLAKIDFIIKDRSTKIFMNAYETW